MKVCAILFLCFTNVFGAIFRSNIENVTVNGEILKVCKYGGLESLPGAEFRDDEKCLRCTCSEAGLECKTLVSDLSVTVPEDSVCISKVTDCVNYWVMRNNTNKPCPRDLIPTENISQLSEKGND